MTLPTFLICGIQKGGTTALHAYLAGHPDVFCPARKELNFFDQNWERGLAWYERQFQDAALGRPLAIGEASPHYQRFETAARRITEVLPDGYPRLTQPHRTILLGVVPPSGELVHSVTLPSNVRLGDRFVLQAAVGSGVTARYTNSAPVVLR